MNDSATTVTRYVDDNPEMTRSALYLAYDQLLTRVRSKYEGIGDDQYYTIYTTNAVRHFESSFATGGTYDEFRIYHNRVELASVHVNHEHRREPRGPVRLNTDALTIHGFASLVQGLVELLY